MQSAITNLSTTSIQNLFKSVSSSEALEKSWSSHKISQSTMISKTTENSADDLIASNSFSVLGVREESQWGETDLQEVQEKLQQNLDLLKFLSCCQIHHLPYEYYCLFCCEKLCTTCFLQSTKHRGHRFRRHEGKDDDMNDKGKYFKDHLSFKKEYVLILRQRALRMIHAIEMKEQKMIGYFYTNCIEPRQINAGCGQCCQDKRKDFDRSYSVLSDCENIYSSCLKKLKSSSSVALIKGTGNQIEEQLLESEKSISAIVSGLNEVRIEKQKVREICHPPFEQKLYTVYNFKKLKNAKKQIISEPFSLAHNRWKLKIYPGGYTPAGKPPPTVEYFSIYVERVGGVDTSMPFIVRVELFKKRGQKQIIGVSKQFKSSYDLNESWGYDRYMRIYNLYQNGFLLEDDIVKIRLTIAPANYQNGCSMLATQIEKREKVRNLNQDRIKKLKQMIQQKNRASQPQQKIQKEASPQPSTIKQLIKENPPFTTPQQAKNPTAPLFENLKKVVDAQQQKFHRSMATYNRIPETQKFDGNGYRDLVTERKGKKEQLIGRTSVASSIRNHGRSFASISLQKNQSSKVIRLVSLKNLQLISRSNQSLLSQKNSCSL